MCIIGILLEFIGQVVFCYPYIILKYTRILYRVTNIVETYLNILIDCLFELKLTEQRNRTVCRGTCYNIKAGTN